MPDEIEFVVRGKSLRLSRLQVQRAMRGATPEAIQRHAVEIGGVRYPVKQAFERATGLDRLDFTSEIARRNLGKLGFRLVRVRP